MPPVDGGRVEEAVGLPQRRESERPRPLGQGEGQLRSQTRLGLRQPDRRARGPGPGHQFGGDRRAGRPPHVVLPAVRDSRWLMQYVQRKVQPGAAGSGPEIRAARGRRLALDGVQVGDGDRPGCRHQPAAWLRRTPQLPVRPGGQGAPERAQLAVDRAVRPWRAEDRLGHTGYGLPVLVMPLPPGRTGSSRVSRTVISSSAPARRRQ